MILEELRKLLYNAGVKRGDVLYVASDVTSFGIPTSLREGVHTHGLSYVLDAYIKTFQECVGPEGAVLMPTFSYSACKGELFDVQRTPSTVGALTEHFRKQPGVIRSRHPVFSIAGWGGKAKSLLTFTTYDCFGPGSHFERFEEENITYVFFGINLQEGATFLYGIEQERGVYYRYFKEFHGVVKDGAETIEHNVRYYVRDRDVAYKDDWNALEEDALAAGVLKKFSYGSGSVSVTKAKVVSDLARAKLSANEEYLIRRLD